MHVLRDELKNIEVKISSDYSPDLAEALVRGRLDVAFQRVEPNFDLGYEVVDNEPLIVLTSSDHRLTSREAIHPRELVGEIFIGGSNKACGAARRDRGLPAPRRARHRTGPRGGQSGDGHFPGCVDRGLALMPAYAKNLLPWSVVSRHLEGKPPTIELAVGYIERKMASSAGGASISSVSLPIADCRTFSTLLKGTGCLGSRSIVRRRRKKDVRTAWRPLAKSHRHQDIAKRPHEPRLPRQMDQYV